MNIVEFKNNVPQTSKPLNGFYELKRKQERNGRFLSKYWLLCSFTAYHMPEGSKIEVDMSNPSKEMMSEVIKSIRGVKSVSFAKMSEDDFKEHYSRTLDECCKLLGTSAETVINELVGFM